MDKFITVYKASAGAGKTYTLTQDYIKLILENEEAYRHVLAVTFTNKATDEMKQRILKELYKMASDPSCAEQQRARNVLVKILHDYPAFSVSTIDKFFQSVMRAFARELGRMMTYSVELDEKMVLAEAVDNMFADLDKSENSELLEWLIEFSLDQIESGDSWKIQENISNLSRALFSEKFKVKNGDTVYGTDDFIPIVRNLKKKLSGIISDYEKRCREIGERALSVMAECGLEYFDFKGKSNSPFKIFASMAKGLDYGKPLNKKLYDFYNDVEAWYTKDKAAEAYRFEQAYEGGLNNLLGDFIEHYEKSYKLYRTSIYARVNLNSLAILGKVYSYILDYCKEKNVVLLSETTELLSRIIDGNDTPFIYERVGTWVNHFMLDEFQDTSLMQWNNFVPLLANSIANGDKNLIVGDIKQSIYRFRNSDWSILQSGIEDKFSGKVHEHPLKENWRSAKNIISFNNSFFVAAASEAARAFEGDSPSAGTREKTQLIRSIYGGFAQNASPKSIDGGLVTITFIDNKASDEVADYASVVAAGLLQNVRRLLARGYRQKDIGILVRNNKEGAEVARILLEADSSYRVVSADSLFVSSSDAVERIINVLQWVEDPNSLTMSVIAAVGNSDGNLPDQELLDHLKSFSLYQMCEEIIRCCLNEEQRSDLAFLEAFLDLVLEYSVREGSSLSGFLKWWNETGCGKSISSPDNQDAFQVMTIHKSKGLDFEVVILPYFKESLDYESGKAPLLWSTSASDLFGYNGPLPVKYVKDLSNTLFEDDYLQEKLAVYIDNLNIAYVAFTRAVRELVVIAEKPKEKDKESMVRTTVAAILYDFVNGGYKFSSGPVDDSGLEKIQIEQGVALLDVEGVEIACDEYHSGTPLAPSDEQEESYKRYFPGSQFTAPLDEKRLRTILQSGSINEELTLRDNGILMHDLFAAIKVKKDVGRVEDPQIREKISEMLESVEEYGWFSDKYNVLNECSILNTDGTLSRPDRVLTNGSSAIVVDYKFGEYISGNKKYHKQVQRYMQLLMEMDFTSVKGFLWYPVAGVVEPVL